MGGSETERYRVLGVIGEGGFGEVLLVQEQLTGAYFAHKSLKPGAAQELEGLKRYRNAIRSHPHLVGIYEIGESGDGLYYTMELADNLETADIALRYSPDTLAARIANAGGLRAEEIVWYLFRLLEGLGALHGAGFAHGDIKPANIIFVNSEPKLADIGLLCARQGKAEAGTPGYVRPEYGDIPADAQAGDLHALAVVILDMLGNSEGADDSALAKRLREFAHSVCDEGKPVRSVSEFTRRLAEYGITPEPQIKKKPFLRRTVLAAGLLLITAVLGLGGWEYFAPAQTVPEQSKPASSGGGTRIYSFFSPDGGTEAAILREIGKSARSIRVAVYFFTRQELAEALIEAKARGALVEVVVDRTQEKRKDSMVPLLVSKGIPVYVDSRHRIMHNKFVVIGSDTVITGSQNWTTSADSKNAENTLIIRNNRHLAQKYIKIFEELKEGARLLPVQMEQAQEQQ